MLPSKCGTRAGEVGGPDQGDRHGAIRRQICLYIFVSMLHSNSLMKEIGLDLRSTQTP